MQEFTDSGTTYCLISAQALGNDMYILGDAFLRAWYSIYDLENNKAGLVQTFDSTATIKEYSTFPGWAIALIIAGGVIIIVIIVIVVNRCQKKKRERSKMIY